MASGSFQASSITSRMRETGIELAIDEGGRGLLPIRVLVSWEPTELPPLPVNAAPSHRRLAGPSRSPQRHFHYSCYESMIARSTARRLAGVPLLSHLQQRRVRVPARLSADHVG